MTHISSNPLYLPLLCKATQYGASQNATCLVCADEQNRPVAGVIYDGYNGGIIHAHIWIDPERRPSREWYVAIFDYPFNRVGVTKIIGQVSSSNEDAQKLDENFGFVKEAEIAEYFDDGSTLFVYTMKKEQCKILNSRVWAPLVEKIRRLI